MNKDTISSIIQFAIDNEVESYEFYKNAAEKVTDRDLNEIFVELAEEELEHKRFLEEFSKSEDKKIVLDSYTDYNISETFDTPELSTEMNFKEAIQLAIKKEEEAMIMYETLAKDSNDSEVEKLFLGLKDMEQMHKARLEEIYTNVAYVEVW